MIKIIGLFVVAALCIGGCSPTQPVPQGYAECPVCKASGDLACVHVKKNTSTQSVTLDGETIYFCSEECKHRYIEGLSS